MRHIGVSNFDVAQLRRAQAIAPVETLQPQYSLIARDVEDAILPYAEREGIGVIVYSPMGSGMLTGRMTRERIAGLPDDDWRRHDPRFREPQLTAHLALVERLQAVAARHGVTPAAVAIAWTLRNPAVDGAIVGVRRPDQVDPVVAAAGLALDDDDMARIAGADVREPAAAVARQPGEEPQPGSVVHPIGWMTRGPAVIGWLHRSTGPGTGPGFGRRGRTADEGAPRRRSRHPALRAQARPGAGGGRRGRGRGRDGGGRARRSSPSSPRTSCSWTSGCPASAASTARWP